MRTWPRSCTIEQAERCADDLPPRRPLRLVLGSRAREVLGISLEAGAPLAPSQLIQRGVAGNPEQPRLHRAAAAAVAAPLAVGALERLGGHVLGGRVMAVSAT
jgi:hypothetical protein